jgi:hypothetical protein
LLNVRSLSEHRSGSHAPFRSTAHPVSDRLIVEVLHQMLLSIAVVP